MLGEFVQPYLKVLTAALFFGLSIPGSLARAGSAKSVLDDQKATAAIRVLVDKGFLAMDSRSGQLAIKPNVLALLTHPSLNGPDTGSLMMPKPDSNLAGLIGVGDTNDIPSIVDPRPSAPSHHGGDHGEPIRDANGF